MIKVFILLTIIIIFIHLIVDEKPFKLEVFEDYLFVTTYHTHKILRINKFGNENTTYLAQGLPRLSDILIVQENRQKALDTNRCVDFCHPSEFCLLIPKGATCSCADGFTKDNYVSVVLIINIIKYYLN